MSWVEALGRDIIKSVKVEIGDKIVTTAEVTDGKLKVAHYNQFGMNFGEEVAWSLKETQPIKLFPQQK